MYVFERAFSATATVVSCGARSKDLAQTTQISPLLCTIVCVVTDPSPPDSPLHPIPTLFPTVFARKPAVTQFLATQLQQRPLAIQSFQLMLDRKVDLTAIFQQVSNTSQALKLARVSS